MPRSAALASLLLLRLSGGALSALVSRHTRKTAVLAALLLGLVSTAHPQGTYRDGLERQLSAIGQAISGSGYRPDATALGYAEEGLEAAVTFESTSSMGLEVVLQAGVRYRIVTDFFDWDGDDCGKSIEDLSGNTLFTGAWSEDRFENVLAFTPPGSGTHILVVHCPDGVGGFFYEVQRMSPEGSYQSDPGAFPRDMTVGFLRSGATVGLELTLDPGVEYLIAGVCDQDCSDLDLAVADSQGAILFTDEMDDDAPVLQFVSTTAGFHTVWVTMYACSVEPCSFAYRVFRR